MEEAASFGIWLKRQRKALDLTQKDLADRVGCSVAAIQKIEREERRPSRQLAHLLAQALEVPEEQRNQFLKVARGEGRLESLPRQGGPTSILMPASEPAARAVRSPAKIPTPSTPLIGRETELSQIARLLQEEHCRLLTLTGEGGIGKTRLALEVARLASRPPEERQESAWSSLNFPDGVFFVPLAGVTTGAQALPALAAALDFSFYPNLDPLDQLVSYLEGKQALIILDNFEHLVAESGRMSEILSRAPGVKALVTSQERLRLQGEWVVEMSGLPYPLVPEERLHSRTAAPAYPESFSAVALFVQSARRRDYAFELTPQNTAAVVEICRLVDGMPLGLELAAAWLPTLTPEEIAREIQRDLGFLTAPTRDIPERHRSLRAVFDHSWEMLSPAAQQALSRLSIFRGGFRRPAAEMVGVASLSVLSELVEKSMIRRASSGRYEIHELIRQNACARLEQQAEEYRETCERHASYFMSLLRGWEPQLRNEQQKEALEELSREMGNIRLAWEWSVSRQDFRNLRKGAVSLMMYHELRNLWVEGEKLFRQALASMQGPVPEGDPERFAHEVMLGDILAQTAWFSFRLGRMEEALRLFQESLELLRKYNEVIVYGDVLWYYSFASWFAGKFEEAAWAVEESLEINAALGRRWQTAITEIVRAGIAHEQGQYEQAQGIFQKALALCRSTGDPRLITTAISFFGRTQQVLGQYEGMQELYNEALRLATETGDRYGQGLSLERLAFVAQETGDPARAEELYRGAVDLYREIGDAWSLSRLLNQLGCFAFQQGELPRARQIYRQALHTAMGARVIANALDALAGLAQVFAGEGKTAAAREIIQVVCTHPSSTVAAREICRELRPVLGEEAAQQTFEDLVAAQLSDWVPDDGGIIGK